MPIRSPSSAVALRHHKALRQASCRAPSPASAACRIRAGCAADEASVVASSAIIIDSSTGKRNRRAPTGARGPSSRTARSRGAPPGVAPWKQPLHGESCAQVSFVIFFSLVVRQDDRSPLGCGAAHVHRPPWAAIRARHRRNEASVATVLASPSKAVKEPTKDKALLPLRLPKPRNRSCFGVTDSIAPTHMKLARAIRGKMLQLNSNTFCPLLYAVAYSPVAATLYLPRPWAGTHRATAPSLRGSVEWEKMSLRVEDCSTAGSLACRGGSPPRNKRQAGNAQWAGATRARKKGGEDVFFLTMKSRS